MHHSIPKTASGFLCLCLLYSTLQRELCHLGFGVWGERQKSDWKPGNPIESFLTTNGYTGHDQLDSHNLVHMGGRVYDPNLGRFLSADIFIQSPYDSQNYNRYSYVGNNPLSYTDPSGYRSKGVTGSMCDANSCTTYGKSTEGMDFVKWWTNYTNNAQDYYVNVGGFAGGVGYVAVGIADGMVGQDVAAAADNLQNGDLGGAAVAIGMVVFNR